MRIMTSKFQIATTLAFCLLAFARVPYAEEAPTDSFLSRQGSVEKLLNESSAAKQVAESGNAEANRLRDQARQKYADAARIHESGDAAAAATQLSEAVRLMYAAVSAAQQKGATTEKENRDYQNRRLSVAALLRADQRIAEEQGQQKEHARFAREIEKELLRADGLLESGDGDGARDQLDTAYELVMLSVEGQRQGDTLVRELNFETEEDEYVYELDLNDTHKLLVGVLLEEKLADPRINATVTTLVASADKLRAAAELQAGKGNFSDAIKTLEDSTRELVKAIRSAGVYIPG